MSVVEMCFIGLSLAMDAFAVSICKGLSMKTIKWKKGIIIAAYFSLFQMLMPVLGYIFAYSFKDIVQDIDHWIAFVLLSAIGANMIKEAFCSEENEKNDKVDFRTMFILAVATSIDALAVGATFAFLQVNLIMAVLIIGIITLLLSLIGIKIGNLFGDKFKSKAEIAGGVILIFIGLKILLDHLGILS